MSGLARFLFPVFAPEPSDSVFIMRIFTFSSIVQREFICQINQQSTYSEYLIVDTLKVTFKATTQKPFYIAVFRKRYEI